MSATIQTEVIQRVSSPVGKSLPYRRIATQPEATSQTEVTSPLEPTSETEVRPRLHGWYEVIDEPTHGFYLSAKNGEIPVTEVIASGTSLTEVLAAARKYLASDDKWIKCPQIEVLTNGNSVWRISAKYVKMYGHKLLIQSFKRRLTVYFYPSK